LPYEALSAGPRSSARKRRRRALQRRRHRCD